MSFTLPTLDLRRPRGLGYGARLGDLWLRLAPTREGPLNTYSRDSLAERTSDTSSSYENVLDVGYTFSRSDFSGGEGLGQYPRVIEATRQALDETRFYDSRNLEILRPDEKLSSLRLANTFFEFDTHADASNDHRMMASNRYLYTAAGTTVRRYDDPTDETSVSSTDFTPQTVVSCAITPDDEGILLLDNTNLYHKKSSESGWTQVTETTSDWANAVQVYMVKNRVIMVKESSGNWEIGEANWDTARANGTFAAFDTFTSAVLACIDAGSVILVATADGLLRSYVAQTDTAGTAPDITVRAVSPMPQGEIAYNLGYNLGVLLILTIEKGDNNLKGYVRAYNAEVLDERFDFIVGNMQLVKEWDGVMSAIGPYGYPHEDGGIVTDRDSFWWTVTEIPVDNPGDYSGPAVWTQNIVTRGVSRYSKFSTTLIPGSATGIKWLSLWYGRLALFTNQTDDKVILQDIDAYQSVGWLISPRITFGLDDDINWISSILRTLNVVDGDGAQVELYVSTNPDAILDWQHASWKPVTRISTQASSGAENILVQTVAPAMAFQIRMYSNQDGTGSPEVERVQIRGLPKHRDIIVDLPVNVSDYIEVPGRRSIRIPHYGTEMHQALLSRLGRNYQLQLVEPPMYVNGIVDQIAEPVEYVSNRGAVTKVCLVRFRGTYAIDGQGFNPTGNETMGVGLMGIAAMGVGQTGAI